MLFYTNTGLNPLNLERIKTTLSNFAIETFAKDLKHVYNKAKKHLEQILETMKGAHDHWAQNVVEYHMGDKVTLDGWNIAMDRPTKKFADK